MGKRTILQRRGRGSSKYRSPSHRFKYSVDYPRNIDCNTDVGGQVTSIVHDAARSPPVAEIILEDFNTVNMIAADGLSVGQWIQIGPNAKPSVGSVMPLGSILEGTEVYNIELQPGDGGKLVRSSGTSASVVGHPMGFTQIRLPSKKTKLVNSKCRATIGRVAGSGRKDKFLVHAGQSYYAKKARGKRYPIVGGTSMNALNHPHGGGRHPHVGKPTTISRNTPPGRRAGHVAAKRTGLRKKK